MNNRSTASGVDLKLSKETIAEFEVKTNQFDAQLGQSGTSVTQAVTFVFHCVVNPQIFSIPFDFAVRDWARRSATVRAVLHASEDARIAVGGGVLHR